MNPSNISKIQRRKPRKSMLGTRRPNGMGFQLDARPVTQIKKKVSSTNSVSTRISAPRKSLRKSVLSSNAERRNSIFSMISDTSSNSPIIIDSSAGKADGIDDSFEKNETFMMADVNEDEEPTFVHSLLNNATKKASVIPRQKTDVILSDNSITSLDATITLPQAEDTMLTDLMNSLNHIIENNTRCVNRYRNQIDEIENEIEERNRQTKDLVELKCRLVEKFNLDESANPMLTTKSPEQTEIVSLEHSAIVPEINIVSPSCTSVSSKQIIHELRSTLTFLKTPRSRCSRRPRQSIMLTPHSMSFCVQSQLEELLQQ